MQCARAPLPPVPLALHALSQSFASSVCQHYQTTCVLFPTAAMLLTLNHYVSTFWQLTHPYLCPLIIVCTPSPTAQTTYSTLVGGFPETSGLPEPVLSCCCCCLLVIHSQLAPSFCQYHVVCTYILYLQGNYTLNVERLAHETSVNQALFQLQFALLPNLPLPTCES